MEEVLVKYMAPNATEVAVDAREHPLSPITSMLSSDPDQEVNPTEVAPTKVDRPRVSEDLISTAQHALRAAPLVADIPDSVLDPALVASSHHSSTFASTSTTHFVSGPHAATPVPDFAMDGDSPGPLMKSNVSDDVADALVSLKQRSPNGFQAQLAQQGLASGSASLSSRPSTYAISTPDARAQRPMKSLPTTAAHFHRSPVGTSAPSSARPAKAHLPPIRYVNNATGVAQNATIHSTEARNTNGTTPSGVWIAPPGMPQPSPASTSSSDAVSRQNPTRLPIQYMTAQRRQQFIQAPQPPLSYLSGQTSPDVVPMSPPGAYDDGRDVSDSPPSPDPGHLGSHPYYYNRRPSHASENGPPYAPLTIPDSPYPPLALTDGNGGSGGSAPFADTIPMHLGTSPPDQPLVGQPVPRRAREANGDAAEKWFACTYPGCNARPFPTQYLLNSHANVHSQDRPHFCVVPGCPRGPGGKGFKRKNEMIRHGLVHASPGYVCPYCPDREHRYPRPDNLQRHVRVHHMDKGLDDPALRDVLSQRVEGGQRGRRRRSGH
ncbi:MAG: hypothetical protein M1826_007346 [Phylliscum demangeonii]|nr:MAG: hypothetical protein M1826_007346 [Phylliscum demangeonii]